MSKLLAGVVGLLLASPASENLAGHWNAELQASFSSCEGTAIGDLKVEQWELTGSGSALTVAITDQKSGKTESYTGVVESDGAVQLRAHEKQLKLKLIGKELVGRRVHMTTFPKHGSCTILYDVRATRG